jgi:hypothetical protein
MENLILFFKIMQWLIWPIVGILAGLVIGRFTRNLNDFQDHAKATIYGYILGMIFVGMFYLILLTFIPDFMGIDMHWGTYFLNFFIQVMIFYATSLATTWLMVRKKYNNKK